MDAPLKKLAIVDPDLATRIQGLLEQKAAPVAAEGIDLLVNETLWAFSREIAFGRAVAEGYADLVGEAGTQQIACYRDLVREFGNEGPTLGRMMAVYLVPVCKWSDRRLIERFLDTVRVMLAKGSYTLKDPLEMFTDLLTAGDHKSAWAYLHLLDDAFAGELSYVQCQHFAHVLPRAVRAFSSTRRVWQIKALRRVVQADARLADAFLDGFEKGLHLLDQSALDCFVSMGREKLKHERKSAMKFLSLESQLSRDIFSQMQVTIPFSQIRSRLNRYLHARTGQAISVRSLSQIPDVRLKADRQKTWVCSDGKFIYLPPEISRFPHKIDNMNLYLYLAKLEAGHYEYHTFDFDLEKLLERCGQCFISTQKVSVTQDTKDISDLERFFQLFPIPGLADDLFTIFEHGRVRVLLGRQYPGLVRQTLPVFQQEAMEMLKSDESDSSLLLLYLRIALGFFVQKTIDGHASIHEHTHKWANLFEKKMKNDPVVEACAELVTEIYPKMAEILERCSGGVKFNEAYRPLATPFGRRVRPDLFFSAHRRLDQTARQLKIQIEKKGFRVYKSSIQRHLITHQGTISLKDLNTMILNPPGDPQPETPLAKAGVDLSWLDLSKFLDNNVTAPMPADDVGEPVFWYKEWDYNLQDYLTDHVRVLDRRLLGREGDFYNLTLHRHDGLVKNIRHAFELLKPEGLVRLRQWVEGDEFDYQALLDFAVDRRAGKIPSDRLYIKRIKQTRDVAVLLLVDLSRSTANIVNGSNLKVLDVEKEAIVLFCEALEVVGDAFAIAGFSGTGRLGVDYFRIKDFNEKIDIAVKQRIHAMTPQRSTRMGAAIRHATAQLKNISAKVRLLIILGDGFPNDVDYKQFYAIYDTAKAIFEAHSKNIYAHAITVNMTSNPQLDDLYGNIRHNVISDVRELPHKLLRIYNGLTRC